MKGSKDEGNIKTLYPIILLAVVFMAIGYYSFTEGFGYGKQLAFDEKAEMVEMNTE